MTVSFLMQGKPGKSVQMVKIYIKIIIKIIIKKSLELFLASCPFKEKVTGNMKFPQNENTK